MEQLDCNEWKYGLLVQDECENILHAVLYKHPITEVDLQNLDEEIKTAPLFKETIGNMLYYIKQMNPAQIPIYQEIMFNAKED
jgi:hypothetical protein